MMFGQTSPIAPISPISPILPIYAPGAVGLNALQTSSGGGFDMSNAPQFPMPEMGSTAGMNTTPVARPQPAGGPPGAHLSPDQLELRQKLALQQAQPDYSPVQSWTQGLARVANNLVGSIELGRLDKQSQAAEADRQKSVAALLGDGGGTSAPSTSPVAAALLSNDPIVQKMGMWRLERDNPKAVQPHYWESNNGSLFSVGANGQPQEIYHDPSPKMNFIPDGQGGGQWVPVPDLASAPAAANATQPSVGAVVADPRKGTR